MASNEKILKEIRDNFDYCVDYWREIYNEGDKDMRYLAGDPWPDAEKTARKGCDRPFLALDELNQYVNQCVNDMRQNKRAVKITPEGNGATDQTAEWRGGIIRNVEYKSRAQAAYLSAYENAVERSFGFFGISTDYEADDSFNQVLKVRRIPNPRTVYLDPDAKEADCSDAGYAYELDTMQQSKFKARWPDAETADFSTEMMDAAPAWIKGDRVQVASYWKLKTKERTLVLLANDTKLFIEDIPGAKLGKDGFAELPGGERYKVQKQRKSKQQTLTQYITNGLEILEENPVAGRWIPIIPVFGKEIWVDSGAGSKRVILSLTRLARDPYMLYCYARTCQAELAGMTPKIPLIGYEGQFDTATDWANITKTPQSYAEVKAITTATGAEILPKPEFQNWEPPIQSLELLAESAKRAIQSAMGMYNTSVGRQDTNARSGVAINALDRQSDTGNFHFVDNYETALEHGGRIMNDLLDTVYDSARDVGIRNPDESYGVLSINQPAVHPENKTPINFQTDEGDHGVTLSTGPAYDSQRDEASQFADQLAQNEAVFPRIADLVVKLKDLGPIGDEIADRLTPPDIKAQKDGNGSGIPPQFLAKLQAAEALIARLQQEKAADLLAQQTKIYIAKIQAQSAAAVALAKSGMDAAAEKLWAEIEIVNKHWDMQQAAMIAAAAPDETASGAAGGAGSDQSQAAAPQAAA